MSDLKQALRDFVTTSNSGIYATEEELMSKFPELQGYDIQVLRDFVTTSNSGIYADEETLFSKFPEFGIGQQPKKKEDGGLLQKAQRTIQQYSQSLSPSQESESQQLSPSVSSLVEPYKEQKVKKLSPVGTTPVDTTAIDYTTIQEDLSWQDKIGVGGSQSSINQNKIESEEKAKELAILEEKRRKKEAADDITRAREMFARRAEEEKIRLENEKLNLDYRTKDLNFLSNLNSVTSDLISTTEENVVQKLNEKFKGNGIVFEEAGWGTNRIIARTEDGKSVINIGSYNFLDSANTSEAEKLRNFISKNAKRTEDIGDRDFLSNSLKAQNLRAVPMIENGEPSTVRFTSFEENGKFLVIPTLFPKDPNKYTTNPSTWMELPFEQARKVAMERGEVFTFKTQKEADDFAKGSWKDVNTIDIEGDSFFKALGKDYMTEKKRYERFTELDDIIDFAEKVYKYEGTSMTEQELQKKYPKYFISGKARFDLEKMLPEMKKERDALKPLVKDYTFFNQEGTSEDARMMWDKYLQDRNNQISSQAAAVRRDADIQEMNLDKKSYEKFGVSIKDLKNYAVTNPSQKKEYDQLINQYVDAQDKKVIASEYMQEAKLYFDAKDNKNIMQEFSENFSGVVNSTLDAYRENAGGAALLNFAIGLKNAHKIKDVKEASEYIKNLRESMSGTQSKELTRFQNVSDFSELIDVISDDPISVITSLVGSSFATQLPVGTKIIPATVLTSTAYGGATAGIPGAVGGFFSGLSTGQAITEFATEYNTALIDAIKKRGYDMEDPYSLQKALLNKEVWDEALEIGVTRGIPMAIMEKVTGGLSGRVFVPSSRLATTASKLKGYALESAVIDPTSEMLGELAAQGAMVATGKQDKIQYTELYGEFLGGLGAKSMTNGASTLYKIVRDHNNINLAYDLTDVANIAKENVSDERIMSWADNMVRLGKIDNTVAHRIRENVGLKREAKELMSVGEKPSNEVVARTMELMAAKQELTKTKNRSEVYRDKISEIDEELANMASTKKVADKDNQTSLVGITDAVRPSVAEYTINNRRYTKERFLDKINSMSPGRISRNDVKVVGDEEIVNLLNKKTNAVQEQTAGQVSVQPTTGVSQEVAQGESQTESQVTTGQGVTEEKPKEKISVYRGIGNNVMGSDNSSTLWVAEDKEVAKNYAGTLEDGTLNVQSLEVEKPSNPIEMPYKLATDVRGSNIANNLRLIRNDLYESKKITDENFEEITKLIDDFESKAGNDLELFTTKLNKAEANEAFSKVSQALGFDGIIQKESAARGGEMTNTYGIFKNKYSSLLQPTSETKMVDATPTIAEVAPTERTPEQEADLLEELVSGMPLFQKGEQLKPVEDIEAVIEEMNSMPDDVANFDVPSDLSTDKKINIKSLIKRFGNKLKTAFKGGIIKNISEYNGIPMIFTISDQLSSGKIKNEFTGNTIDVNGGLGFNLTDGNENNAWANTTEEESVKMLNRAKDVYDKNKDLFDRLWAEGKLPYGQIPMAIVKMGQDSIKTNEALFRFASDTIKAKFSETERKNSLNGLIDDIVSFVIDSENRRREKKGEDLMTQEEIDAMSKDVLDNDKVIGFIKENDYKTIDQLLDNLNKLSPIGERATVTNFLFTGSLALNKETKPGKPRSKSALALVGDKDSSYYKYIHLQTINNIIQEDSTKEIPSSHIIGITGVDVLNPEITSPNHRNYPYGVKGGLIGILESPVHAADVFPEMYSKTFYLQKENAAGKPTAPKTAVEQSVASGGLVVSTKAFVGSKMSTKMTELQKLLGKLKLAFPSVTIIETQQEFEKALEDPEVKKFVKDGEIVYGFTKDGKIFLNPEKANKNTAIHEFAHIWVKFLKENNPKLLEKGYALLEGTEILKRKIKEFGDIELAREEALAELIANKGETLIEAGKKSKFKNWLNALYTYVKSKFKSFDKLSPEEFQNISLNDFVDGALASLLSGKEITSKEIKSIGVLFSKEKPKKNNDIIQIARANGIPEAGIRAYFKKNGLTDIEIDELLEKTEGATGKIELSEETLPGYTKLMNRIKDVIKRSRSRGLSENQIMENVIANVESRSTEYANATNQQQEQIIRDIRKMFGKKEKAAPSEEKITGKPKPKKVTVNEMTALKDQIKLEVKAAREGAKSVSDAVKAIVEYFNSIKDRGNITRKDLIKILGIVSKVNSQKTLDNAANKIFEIIGKAKTDIIEVSELKALKDQLRLEAKAAREAKGDLNAKRKMLAAAIKEMVKKGKITVRQAAVLINKVNSVNLDNPVMVERILDYAEKVFNDAEYGNKLSQANSNINEIKTKIKNLKEIKSPILKELAKQFSKLDPSLVEDIDLFNSIANNILDNLSKNTVADVINYQDLSLWLAENRNKQEEIKKARLVPIIEEITGQDAKDLTYDQMIEILESLKEKSTEKDETEIREKLQEAFDNAVIAYQFDEKNPIVDRFINIDLSKLSVSEIVEVVYALANYIENKDTAKMETIISMYEGNQSAESVSKKNLKISKFRAFSRFMNEQFAALPILFEKLFNGVKRGMYVMDMMGLSTLINSSNEAKNIFNGIVADYVSKFYSQNPNSQEFNTLYNNVERGMLAALLRSPVGNIDAIKKDFERNRGLILDAIEKLSRGDDNQVKIAQIYQQVYDKILKDSKDATEVLSKVDPINAEAVNWWINQWSDVYDEMYDVSLNVYNKQLDKDYNYTSSKFSFINLQEDIIEDDMSSYDYATGSSKMYEKMAGNLMKAIKPTSRNLNKGMYLDLNFDTVNANAMSSVLVDIKTAASIKRVKGFVESKYFPLVIPDANMRAVVTKRINDYIKNIRKKRPYDSDEFGKVINLLETIAKYATSQALGGVTQPIKQIFPGMLNTIIQTHDLSFIVKVFNSDVHKFLNESGYGISNRGVEASAQLESINKMIEIAAQDQPSKVIKKIGDINDMMLKALLVKPDIFIARASWIAYYEQYMRKNNKGQKINYATHKINKEAADYAETMTSRQLNLNDADLAGSFFLSNDTGKKWIRNTLLPFANFRINQYLRTASDVSRIVNFKTTSKEDRVIAIRSLVGTMAETVLYKSIAVGIGLGLTGLSMAVRGDDDEEEWERAYSNAIKGSATSAVTDFLSPIPLTDQFVRGGVGEFIDLVQALNDVPVEDRWNIFTKDELDVLDTYGKLGIPFKRVFEIKDGAELVLTGKFEDKYGNVKYITDQDREILLYGVLGGAFVNVFGLGVGPEYNNTYNKIVKQAKRDAQTEKQIEKKIMLGDWETKEDMKRYAPEEYEKKFGKGGVYYEESKSDSEEKKKEKEEERKEKDEEYNYEEKPESLYKPKNKIYKPKKLKFYKPKR